MLERAQANRYVVSLAGTPGGFVHTEVSVPPPLVYLDVGTAAAMPATTAAATSAPPASPSTAATAANTPSLANGVRFTLSITGFGSTDTFHTGVASADASAHPVTAAKAAEPHAVPGPHRHRAAAVSARPPARRVAH